MGTLNKPRPLEQTDNRNEFDCGRPSLNTWLQTHAWRNQQLGSSRTNVITNEKGKIVAYVSLTAAEINANICPNLNNATALKAFAPYCLDN